ncbi:MAG: nitrate reductase cytochrome c-type subunit [Marinagarivorans sp.]
MMPNLFKKLLVLMCLVALPFGIQAAEEKSLKEKAAEDQALQVLKTAPALADENAAPEALRDSENKDIKKTRAYPMQPPVIPHKIEGYQISKNANQCLSCHGRTRTQESRAPMVSVTHFMDREGNFLADVSARRYFCNQCHVPQQDRKPAYNNDFIPVDVILAKKKDKQP